MMISSTMKMVGRRHKGNDRRVKVPADFPITVVILLFLFLLIIFIFINIIQFCYYFVFFYFISVFLNIFSVTAS